jgi:hypothetical protein
MNRKLTLRFGMFLFAAFLISSLNTFGAEDRTRNLSTSLYLTIPNDGSIKGDCQLVVHAQLEKTSNVKSIEVLGLEGITATEVRTTFQKDGKVDVDIIIRDNTFLPYLYPYSVSPTANIRIATINYITVDNISGVFQTNTNPTNDVSSRLFDVTIIGGGTQLGSNNSLPTGQASIGTGEVSVQSQSVSQTASETKAVSSESVSLYPNPVRDNMLNLTFGNGITKMNGLRVFNAVGAVVFQDMTKQEINGIYTVQLPSLPAGVYFVRITTGTNEIVKKFNITR